MARKDTQAFINGIPAEKLTGLPRKANTTLAKDINFRLDMQKMINDNQHVLLVQMNRGAKLSGFKYAKGQKRSAALTTEVIVPSAPNELGAEEVREKLSDAVVD